MTPDPATIQLTVETRAPIAAGAAAAENAQRQPAIVGIIRRAIIVSTWLALASSGCARPVDPPVSPPAPTPSDLRRAEAEARFHADWANLERYRAENAALGPPGPGERRVVFMGNSITEGFARHFATLFPRKPYVGRGISGQTTPQMLVRFRQDVIGLRPAVVVILAGTNDIAGNTGPATLEMIQDNITSMVELAHANGIRVVLSSVLPAYRYPWKPDLRPAGEIVALNRWIKTYADQEAIPYVDYHSAMADARQGLAREYSTDGVHPDESGFRVMAPLVERGIAKALEGNPG